MRRRLVRGDEAPGMMANEWVLIEAELERLSAAITELDRDRPSA